MRREPVVPNVSALVREGNLDEASDARAKIYWGTLNGRRGTLLDPQKGHSLGQIQYRNRGLEMTETVVQKCLTLT